MKAKKSSRNRKVSPQHEDSDWNQKQIMARLNAIVMLLANLNFANEDGSLSQKPAAKLLHRAGYTPTEIAKLFGKEKATDVSKLLY